MSANDPIIRALRDSHYLWRTPTGLAKASDAPRESVLQFLNTSDLVVRSPAPNPSGEPLFALRDRVRNEVGLGRRAVDTLLNRSA